MASAGAQYCSPYHLNVHTYFCSVEVLSKDVPHATTLQKQMLLTNIKNKCQNLAILKIALKRIYNGDQFNFNGRMLC